MAHCSDVLQNGLGIEERAKSLLKTGSSAQSDNMKIFEQDTEFARLNTCTVTPKRPESVVEGGVTKATAHFFIIVRSVFSKSKPVAGTVSVSDDTF